DDGFCARGFHDDSRVRSQLRSENWLPKPFFSSIALAIFLIGPLTTSEYSMPPPNATYSTNWSAFSSARTVQTSMPKPIMRTSRAPEPQDCDALGRQPFMSPLMS